MKKSNGQTVDLLYINKKEVNKKIKSKPQNTSRKKKSKTKKTQNNNERINLDNEIIIGLTPKSTETKKKNTPQKSKQQKNVNTQKKQKNKKENIKRKNTYAKTNYRKTIIKKQNPKKRRNLKIIKWFSIIILLIVAVILFMMSSIFNIKQIVVINNSKVPSEEIISLSKLTLNTNMFKVTNRIIRNNIKENAYIENVNIKRNINGTITLDIKERTPTYILRLENNYIYINNQGYMLEISKDQIKLPTITGFSTPDEEIKVGNRLGVDDLNKLNDVVKIIEAAKNSPLANIITEIDITNANDYKLIVASEGKVINLGDMTNVNIKLQMAGKVFDSEKDKKGEVYFQDNAKKAVFREEV